MHRCLKIAIKPPRKIRWLCFNAGKLFNCANYFQVENNIKTNSLFLKIFENWKIIFIIINRNADNYLLFLSSRPLKGRPKY